MLVELFKHIYFRLPLIIRLLLSIFIIMYTFGVIIHFVEPAQFPTIFDGIYWAFVTGATVGFGDYVPLTIPGKIVSILLILSGGGLLTFYITTFSASTVRHDQKLSEGKVAFKGKGHLLIIGWNELTRQLIDLTMRKDPQTEIVLIDHSLSNLPYRQHPVHFIQGDPSEDETLQKAHLAFATRVIISADILKSERQADNHTILSIVALRGHNKEVPIIVEILSESQIENAVRAGASRILRSNDFMSALFYHELFHFEETPLSDMVLYLLHHQQFAYVTLPDQMEGSFFQEVASDYIKQGHLLIGILREEEWLVNPGADFKVHQGDILLTIAS